MSVTSGFLRSSTSTRLSENQELARLNQLETLLLERRVQGVISREEHVSVSTMISMTKFDFSDIGKIATSWRKLEIPSFEIQYQGILNAMQLYQLPPLPSDAKVMPVTKVFISSAASKEEGEYGDISEPEIVDPAPQVETQVDNSANLLSAVNVLSIAPKVDTSNVEDAEMLSDSDDTQGKTDTTTVVSTDKTTPQL